MNPTSSVIDLVAWVAIVCIVLAAIVAIIKAAGIQISPIVVIVAWCLAGIAAVLVLVKLFKHLLTIALIPALLLCSCATNTGDPAKDKRGRITNAVGTEVFNAVLSFGLNEGASLIAGQNGQDASAAAFSAAKQAGAGLISSATFQHIMAAAAGPQVASVATQQLQAAKPQTAAQQAYVINTIGAALQSSNNQLAAK